MAQLRKYLRAPPPLLPQRYLLAPPSLLPQRYLLAPPSLLPQRILLSPVAPSPLVFCRHCSFKPEKTVKVPQQDHYRAGKLQFGPKILSKYMQKRSKTKSQEVLNSLATAEESQEYWMSKVKLGSSNALENDETNDIKKQNKTKNTENDEINNARKKNKTKTIKKSKTNDNEEENDTNNIVKKNATINYQRKNNTKSFENNETIEDGIVTKETNCTQKKNKIKSIAKQATGSILKNNKTKNTIEEKKSNIVENNKTDITETEMKNIPENSGTNIVQGSMRDLDEGSVSVKLDPPLRIPFSRSEMKSLPSVSRVLQATMSEESRRVLAAWEQRMILQLGEAGFKLYKQETFSRGSALHSWLEEYLLTGRRPDTERFQDEVTRRHIESISPLLSKFEDVRVLESAVLHPQLGYCGIMDCVARIGSTLCLIDWKTSERAKPTVESLYDNPLQIVAYLGALNADPNYRHLGRVEQGAVVVIYNSGYPAIIHRLDRARVKLLWLEWLQRIKAYKSQQNNAPI